MNTSILQICQTGGAGAKEWLESIEGWTVIAYDPSYMPYMPMQDISHGSMLVSSPLTDNDIQIGKRIAQKYGLAG